MARRPSSLIPNPCGPRAPLAATGTAFQREVWAALDALPYGATTTYGRLNAALGGSPARARAIGRAIGALVPALVGILSTHCLHRDFIARHPEGRAITPKTVVDRVTP